MITLTVFAGSIARCAQPGNANCLMCHSAAGIVRTGSGGASVRVDPARLSQSAHSRLKCVECHADVRDLPQMHAASLARVDCARCHAGDVAHLDAVHTGIKAGSDRPVCTDCHGSHDIKPIGDPHSRVNRENSTGTCARCHEKEKTLRAYQMSVHGTIEKTGQLPAAVCADCHKVHRTPRLGSSVDCMQCHTRQASEYRASSHGSARAGGDVNAPACTDCHGGHAVLSVLDPDASVSKTSEPRTCAKCHEDRKLMARYDLPANSLKTYRHSYHGKANLHGDERAATCSDCHGAHKVLPSSDPASATSKANLDKTCAKCHPGVNMNVGKGKMHVEITRAESPLLFYVANGFKWLTIGTMVMLCGHIMLDLFSRGRRRLMNSLRRGR